MKEAISVMDHFVFMERYQFHTFRKTETVRTAGTLKTHYSMKLPKLLLLLYKYVTSLASSTGLLKSRKFLNF